MEVSILFSLLMVIIDPLSNRLICLTVSIHLQLVPEMLLIIILLTHLSNCKIQAFVLFLKSHIFVG